MNLNPACVLFLATSLLFLSRPAPGEMVPFVISAPEKGSAVDLSQLNDAPAGAHGNLRVRDGHFIDGKGKRVRFLASNFTFGSCFPEHEQADKLAARLASLGINCIRFHHTDNQAAPRGIWKAGTPKKNQFDPVQLDRLDYFIAALKRHGVYANINLHISRNYWEGEDFPDGLGSDREREEKLPKFGKGLDKINDQMIRMQRDYARALLTHVNPYTGASYANEPCVAIVEINNENSLLQLKVAALPDYYRGEVLRKWNHWLQHAYGSTAKLAAAWGGEEELGPDLLPARIATQGGEFFTVSNAAPGEVRVMVNSLPGEGWHAQLQWLGLTLEEGRLYTLEFSARSDAPRQIAISSRLARQDWHNCGLEEKARLSPEWKSFNYTFRASRVEPDAVRLDMVVGDGPLGSFFLKKMTLRRGGSMGLKAGESLEEGSVAAPSRTQGTRRGLDWTRFLAETERAYTDGMRNFLKKDLRVKAAIIDTQASYGGIAGTYRESFNDYVDMHAYWQHPSFPGRQWDPANWRIRNTPMSADLAGGNLTRLAEYRVHGKPFTVSEYDHPAPSHYAAEMFPMIASFAAVQDWDGLFQFDWGGSDVDSGRVSGFFSLQQHPGKLAFLPAAALMFRLAEVVPASGVALLSIPSSRAAEFTSENVSMTDAWKNAGVSTADLLRHRLEVRFTPGDHLDATVEPAVAPAMAWDLTNGIYTVDAPAAKAVVGRCTGRTTRLNGGEFLVHTNERNFAVLTLNALDGKAIAASRHLLLAAMGNVENTGMKWNADHTTVGADWGKAPTLCEAIGAKVVFETKAGSARVYALSGAGVRGTQVPNSLNHGSLSFEIGPRFKTVWYEIVTE